MLTVSSQRALVIDRDGGGAKAIAFGIPLASWVVDVFDRGEPAKNLEPQMNTDEHG
jgi:hypothetical protein